MDFGVKTSERMFSDVVPIQLNKSLYSQYTVSEKAHVIFADFRPNLTGVFEPLNVYFHLWDSVRIYHLSSLYYHVISALLVLMLGSS